MKHTKKIEHNGMKMTMTAELIYPRTMEIEPGTLTIGRVAMRDGYPAYHKEYQVENPRDDAHVERALEQAESDFKDWMEDPRGEKEADIFQQNGWTRG